MAFLIDEAYRLLRTIWTNPNDLAEELSAMLASDNPVTSTSPIQLQNANGSTMTLSAPASPTDPAITFNFGAGVGDSISLNPGDFSPTSPVTVAGGGSGGGGTPARIVSGTGAAYVVQLYSDGKTPGAKVPATQLQIDPSETIPVGTWVNAVKVGSKYFLFVSVWL